MDIHDIRKQNLRRLIAGVGSVKVLAERAGTDPNWLSALASDKPQLTPKGTIRGIGSDLARKLEKGADKPHGWMDQPHVLTERQKVWMEKFADLPDSLQEKALEYLEMLTLTRDVSTSPQNDRQKPVKSESDSTEKPSKFTP